MRRPALVVQWLRICLLKAQGKWVQSLVQEDTIGHRTSPCATAT